MKSLIYFLFAGILWVQGSVLAQGTPDPRINQIFKKAFFDESIYQDNRCQDNVARLMVALRESGVNIEKLYALEIINKGNEMFGMVAAQKTRDYSKNWFHHVVLYDGSLIYDLDYSNQPKAMQPPHYFHQMFKSDSHKSNRALCDKALGRYQITFRPSLLYLARYRREKVPLRYNLEPVEKMMSQIRGWGCDFNPAGQ